MTALGVAAALVDGELVAGDVDVDGGRVAALGIRRRGGRGVAVPGFIDLQVNGFGGVDFAGEGVDRHAYEAATLAMARTGVTSFLATFPTLAPERYPQVLAVAADAVARPPGGARAIGVHLEGPFLSPDRPGAHPLAHLQPLGPAVLEQLLAVAPVTLVTLAPELPGALDAIRTLAARGVVVAVGHSDATAAEAHAGFEVGASAVTHLWNAQRPPTAREPGVVATALARDDVWVCLIADGVHVAPDVLRVSLRAAGDRAVVVTDAVAPAGLPAAATDDAATRAGLRVAGGAVRLADGTLAGSLSTLDASVRTLVDLGRSLPDAVAAVTSRPAAVLGRGDLGRLAVGGPADVVVLDDDLTVTQVLVAGRSIT